jgi:hypothetical protein
LTRGFPAPFISRIEALSGYRKPSDDADPSVCPVAFSHWIVEGGGVTRHVLSGVRIAPPDHTGRSNKFAHHLLLREEECVPVGPAWLLQQSGVIAESWTGEPRELPQEKRLPTGGRVDAGMCVSWHRAGGDAGWAGVLANAAMLDPAKACSVIVTPGTNALALITEAMLLLPAELRWRVTFTSYFMEPIAGVRCSWRFCIDGTPAAAAARASGGTCIDLSTRARCTRTGRFIEFARTGVMPASKAAAADANAGIDTGIALAPDPPVDFASVRGHTTKSSSGTADASDDSAVRMRRQRRMMAILAASFFVVLSVVVLLLIVQGRKSASPISATAAAQPSAPAKIPDSTAAPIQAVAQPAVTPQEAQLRRDLSDALERIGKLQGELADARRELADARVVSRVVVTQQSDGVAKRDTEPAIPRSQTGSALSSEEPAMPSLTAAKPKAAVIDRTAVMPTESDGWITASLPEAGKNTFGEWSGSTSLAPCSEGADWQWIGAKERGDFAFDGEGITLRVSRPGVSPIRIAEVKCIDGSLRMTWTVTSSTDSSERGWLERLKREVQHVGVIVGQSGGLPPKWIRFARCTSQTVKPRIPVEIPVSGVWQCAFARGEWSDVISMTTVDVPGCNQAGAVAFRANSRGSGDVRLCEVVFEWPEEVSDTSVNRLRDAILDAKEKRTTFEQELAFAQGEEGRDIRKKIRQCTDAIEGFEKSVETILDRRKDIAQCVQDRRILFGPKGEVPTLELVLRIERPTEVVKEASK